MRRLQLRRLPCTRCPPSLVRRISPVGSAAEECSRLARRGRWMQRRESSRLILVSSAGSRDVRGPLNVEPGETRRAVGVRVPCGRPDEYLSILLCCAPRVAGIQPRSCLRPARTFHGGLRRVRTDTVDTIDRSLLSTNARFVAPAVSRLSGTLRSGAAITELTSE